MPRIDANGTSIAYAQTGSGAPSCWRTARRPITRCSTLSPLSSRVFTVIAYDQRDSGETLNPDAPYGLDELGDDLAALIAALRYRRAHVFGTSLGGAIALAAAVRHPDRIDRLILASTFRAGTVPSTLNPETFADLRRLPAGLPETAGEIAAYFFAPDWLGRHSQASRPFAGGGRTEAQKTRRAGILARPTTVDPRAITAPILVLAASGDRLIPPDHTLALAREIAGARTATLPGLGHVATIQDPAAVACEALALLSAEAAHPARIEDRSHAAR
jgi:pimeloyl-ACP methyl ester carboxylesterase